MGPKFFGELSIEHNYTICLDYQMGDQSLLVFSQGVIWF